MNRKRTKPGSAALTEICDNEDGESISRHSNSSPPRNQRSPIRLAKALLRKICLVAAVGNGESREGVVGLLQDAAGGVVLGAMGMSVLLLMDYINVINLETSRVFRRTASDLFQSPGVIEGFEEEMDRRLIPMKAYESMRKELSDSQHAMDIEMEIVEARIKKTASLREELDSIRGEYDRLMKESGLDAFCPTCDWGMGMNCQQRVNYMLEKYSDSATTIQCISKLVEEGPRKNGKCLKPS